MSHDKDQNKRGYSLDDFEFVSGKNGETLNLGVGSFGSVKLVKHKQSQEIYALKIINLLNLSNNSEKSGIEREVRIQSEIRHPHIIKLFGYFVSENFLFLVLEYAEKGNLYTILQKKKCLTEREVFPLFYQTSLALRYLHSKNIVHRDLKPENLLLDKNNVLKLCDFGWCAEGTFNLRNTFCGTYEYMAPEIINQLPYDYRVDVWGVGVLLFELLHGQTPFKGKNFPEIERKIREQKVVCSEKLSLDVQELIKLILRPCPSDRISFDEILKHPWISRLKQEINYEEIEFKEETAEGNGNYSEVASKLINPIAGSSNNDQRSNNNLNSKKKNKSSSRSISRKRSETKTPVSPMLNSGPPLHKACTISGQKKDNASERSALSRKNHRSKSNLMGGEKKGEYLKTNTTSNYNSATTAPVNVFLKSSKFPTKTKSKVFSEENKENLFTYYAKIKERGGGGGGGGGGAGMSATQGHKTLTNNKSALNLHANSSQKGNSRKAPDSLIFLDEMKFNKTPISKKTPAKSSINHKGETKGEPVLGTFGALTTGGKYEKLNISGLSWKKYKESAEGEYKKPDLFCKIDFDEKDFFSKGHDEPLIDLGLKKKGLKSQDTTISLNETCMVAGFKPSFLNQSFDSPKVLVSEEFSSSIILEEDSITPFVNIETKMGRKFKME